MSENFPAKKILNKKWVVKSHIPSPIRKLFEEGLQLKKKHGDNEICDFSLGNPTLPPPDYFAKALEEIAQNPPPDLHCYMPNQGRPQTRDALAKTLSKWYNWPLDGKNLTLTVGAASALSVLFHTILNPGDEVVVIVPYFLEYNNYVSIAGGVVVHASTKSDYDLDIDAIEKVLTPNTRAIIINSPNNPTGRVYSESSLRALGALLTRVYELRLAAGAAATPKVDEDAVSPIFLVSDEPYRRISYLPKPSAEVGGDGLPSVFAVYPYSIVCSSFSKDISIPGERLGYIAVPEAIYSSDLCVALSGNMRECGFVNAPSFMQFAIEKCIDNDISCIPWYQERRDILYEGITKEAGLTCYLPEGAFYLFPKVPGGVTDQEFSDLLKEELVLSVPGSCFGDSTAVRFAYCVSLETIRTAIPRIKKVVEAIRTANTTGMVNSGAEHK